jgi:hypothetical protein
MSAQLSNAAPSQNREQVLRRAAHSAAHLSSVIDEFQAWLDRELHALIIDRKRSLVRAAQGV